MSSIDRSDDNPETSPGTAQKAKSTATVSRSRREFLGKVTAATVTASVVGVTAFEGATHFGTSANAQADLTCPVGCEEGPLKGQARADAAKQRRINAANYEWNMPIPSHPCNHDEETFGKPVNFFANYS